MYRKLMIGKVYGRLTVLHPKGKDSNRCITYECLCSCGNRVTVSGAALRRGKTSSCGCLRHTNGNLSHGMYKTPEYLAWVNLIQRCTNPKNKTYQRYGAKGIYVCDEWLHSFQSFIEDMGSRPTKNHSIDREDNTKGYEPDNCRWATKEEQANNTSRNVYIEYEGVTYTRAQLSRLCGVKQDTLRYRLRVGWPIEKAVSP